MNLFDDEVLQITNYTITDNILVPSNGKERNTLPKLSDEDKANLKLGTNTLSQLVYIIDELEDFSVPQKKIILNATQDILARLKNDYDTLGYYQLWYDMLAFSYTLNEESRFKSSFNSSLTPIDGYTTTTKNTYEDEIELIDISGLRTINSAMSFKTNFTGAISHTEVWKDEENRWSTSFSATIELPIAIIIDGEAAFMTSFTGTIYAPETFYNTTEPRFRTSFTGTIT